MRSFNEDGKKITKTLLLSMGAIVSFDFQSHAAGGL